MTYRRISVNNGITNPPLFTHNLLSDFWVQQAKLSGTFPPYNLVKNEDNTKYILTLAVAGYGPNDISVSVEDNELIITGKLEPKNLPESMSYVHKGIAERMFTKTFPLGEYIEVTNVNYENGILEVYLELNLPEHKKPKKFNIITK